MKDCILYDTMSDFGHAVKKLFDLKSKNPNLKFMLSRTGWRDREENVPTIFFDFKQGEYCIVYDQIVNDEVILKDSFKLVTTDVISFDWEIWTCK